MLVKFEEYLSQNLPKIASFHPHFEVAFQAMLGAGGKRFRPMLLLSVVESKEPLLIDGAMAVATAIEYLHTYSLIHDDLPAMDDAPLRRGVETLHVTYDEATAILVGDGLNTHAFALIADAPLSAEVRIECVKALAYDGGIFGMVLGQAIDLEFENQTLSLGQLQFLHIHKTAKLIASALKMGAIIAGYDKTTIGALYDFGIELGLLFQVQDDILDVIQDAQTAGKTTGNDEAKNTFVNLLGLEGAKNEANRLKSSLETKLQAFQPQLSASLDSILSHYLSRHDNF